MTSPTALLDLSTNELLRDPEHAAKRRRIEAKSGGTETIKDVETLVIRHPLGVRPAGNALTSSSNLKDACGLYAPWPDELLMHFLEYLPPLDLLHLGSSCRALHAFTRNEDLWRALFVESPPTSFSWRGTWRSTCLSQLSTSEPRVDCSNLFSDVLHRPFFCAHVHLDPIIQNIPVENRMARLDTLSAASFSANWVSQPFIHTTAATEWPIYKTWSTERLIERYADVNFRAESVDWPLQTYVEYMNNSHDESPLYLFDRAFAKKMGLLVTSDPDPSAAYWPPTCFGSDLFSLLSNHRPDHRWLIVGPERSGSTFHKDPNATSAWNAVLKGSKYWIMFPSSPSIPPPPGVYISEDQSEITSPLSIAEWLLGFHAEARRTPGCKEGICGAGEVVHVPGGWFHLVLNLEPSIALTQNFVPRNRLGAVLHFLRDQKQSISGFDVKVENPFELFVGRLREYDKDLLDEGLVELDKLSKGARGRWEQITKGDQEEGEENGGGFCFGFGSDDEEDLP